MSNVEIVTLSLNIIAYVLLGLIIIKALIGLAKGVWKTTCSFIVSIILYILVMAFNSNLTSIVYEFDLSYTNIAFNVNNNAINLTTIGDTLRNVIISLSSENVNLSPTSSVFLTFDALARSILSLLVFLVNMIIVAFIIAPLISLLLYHLIFKHLLGANLTKKHKIRLAGFFINGIKATITSCLLLSPFTSIVNQLNNSINGEEFTGENEVINDYVNAYNNSALAKVFTSIKVGNQSIDIVITDYATKNKDESTGEYISFIDEFSMVCDILCEGLKEELITINGVTSDYSQFLSKQFVTLVLQKFASSNLVTTLLPVVLSIAANMDEIKQTIDLSEVDWYKIEWEDELNILSNVYDVFYDSGLTSYIFDSEKIKEYQLNENNLSKLRQTCESLSSSSILTSVMPYVLSSYAKSLEGTDLEGVIPSNPDEYDNVDISNELIDICDTIKTISELSNYVFNVPSEMVNNRKKYYENIDNRYYLTIGDLMDQNRTNQLITFLTSVEAVKGQRYEGNELIEFTSWDGRNIKTENIFNGLNQENDKEQVNGLLDSTLLTNGLPVIIKYGLNSSEDIKNLDITDIIIEETKDFTSLDWKNEVSSLLGIFSVIMNNPNLPLDDTFDIFNETQINELRKITSYISESKLVNKLIEPLLNKLVGDKEIMGLTIADFDFSVLDLGKELDNLLNIMPDINYVQNDLSQGIDAFLSDDTYLIDTMRSVLHAIYDSKIFNPEVENGLNNFERVIQYLFNNEELNKAGFVSLSTDDLLSIRQSGWKNEIDALVNAIGSIGSNETINRLIKNVNDGVEVSIKDIDSSDIENIIKSFSESSIVSHSMGSIFNKYLKDQMETMGISVNFEYVEDWDTEATNFALALDAVKTLDEKGFSLNTSNLDISKLIYEDGTNGAEDLKSLMKSIYQLQCIRQEISTGEYENKFGDIVFQLTNNIFDKYINEEDKALIKQDHEFKENSIAFENNGSIQYVSWVKENPTDGESVIDDICSLIDFILSKDDNGKYPFFNEKNDGTKELTFDNVVNDKEVLKTLLTKINNIYIYRNVISKMLPKLINENVDNLSVEGLDLSYLNTNVFEKDLTLDLKNNNYRKDEINIRQTEINKIVEVYSNFDGFINQIKEGDNINLSIDKFNEAGVQTDLELLLNSMAQSKLFNEKDEKDHTFFEELMRYILVKSSLSEKMANGVDASSYALKAVKNVLNNSASDNEWIDNEINNFIDAIKNAAKISSLFETATGNMLENLNPEDVGNTIKAFSKSKYLNYNNGLAYLLNSQMSSSFDKTGLIIDFTKVGNDTNNRISEWNDEADRLETLLTNIKDLNNGKISFDLEIENIDTNKLEMVLNNLHDLKVVQANNEKSLSENGIDNFGNFVYTNITDKVFSKYIDATNVSQIKNEHCLDTKTYKYDENTNILWSNEIKNICNLLSSIQDNFVVDGKIDFGTINEKTNEVREALNNLNEIYLFRNLIKPIIKNEITGLNDNISTLQLDKAYVSVFSNELDYIAGNYTRKEEVNKRKIELNIIVDIFDNVRDFSSFQGTGVSEFKGKISTIKDTLENIYHSQVLSKNETTEYNTTIFEDVVKFIMDKTTLTDMIYYSKSNLDKDAYVNLKIKNITNDDNLVWDGDNGEINKLCSFLESALTIQDKNGNEFNDISQANNLSTENIKTILNNLNVSYLCHDAVANAVNNVYEESGILKFSMDKNNIIDAHYIENNNDKFSTQISLWQEDIEHLTLIYDEINGDVIDNAILDENGNVKTNIFQKMLPHIGYLHNIDNNKADVIYGIFAKAEVQNYILKTNVTFDVSNLNESFTLEDIYRRQTLNKILEKTDFDWDNEAEKLDLLVNQMLSIKSIDLKNADVSVIENILKSTYSNNRKGYFSSELISSFMEGKINDVQKDIEYDFRKTSETLTYLSLNDYEIQGLTGTIKFASLLGSYIDNMMSWSNEEFEQWCVEFKNALTSMGTKNNIGVYEMYEDMNQISVSGNTEIAEKLYEHLAKEEIQKIDTILKIYGNIDWSMNGKTFEEKYDEWIVTLKKAYNTVHPGV